MERTNIRIKKHCTYCRKEREFYVLTKKKGTKRKYYLKCKECDRFARDDYSLEKLKEMEIKK